MFKVVREFPEYADENFKFGNMADVYVRKLQENYEPILRDLEPRQVLNYLYQEDVIDGDTRDQIRAERTRTKQAEALLACLEKRGPRAIEYFVQGLQRSSQKHLAEILVKPSGNKRTGFSDNTGTPCDIYPMNKKPRGLALIINNAEFQENPLKLPPRWGSEYDATKMKMLFEWLQFEVINEKNCTAAEMENHVRKLALEDHTNYDCCVLFFMSHGLDTGVYGTDGKVLTLNYVTEHLKATFSGTLANKPKLIFIQACRGRHADKGVDVCECPSTDTSPYSTQEANTSSSQPTAFITTDTGMVSSGKIPNYADMYIAFASSFTHAALRNTVTGGWFVSKLYDVIMKDAPHEDLMSMMTKITNSVSEMKTDKDEMQCPQQLTNLRKKLYFFPRNNAL